jgi:hypothetical protein
MKYFSTYAQLVADEDYTDWAKNIREGGNLEEVLERCHLATHPGLSEMRSAFNVLAHQIREDQKAL